MKKLLFSLMGILCSMGMWAAVDVTATFTSGNEATTITSNTYVTELSTILGTNTGNNGAKTNIWHDNPLEAHTVIQLKIVANSTGSVTIPFKANKAIKINSVSVKCGINHADANESQIQFPSGGTATITKTNATTTYTDNTAVNVAKDGTFNIVFNLKNKSTGSNRYVYLHQIVLNIESQNIEYSVSLASSNNTMGTVSGAGMYDNGETATLTATPNAGYNFVNWTNNEGTEVSTENPYSPTISGALSLIANFAESATVENPVIAKQWQVVTMSCATDGASIYYTTNGDTPTSSSTLYNGSFYQNSDATIKAIAIKAGMTASEVVTLNYVAPQAGSTGEATLLTTLRPESAPATDKTVYDPENTFSKDGFTLTADNVKNGLVSNYGNHFLVTGQNITISATANKKIKYVKIIGFSDQNVGSQWNANVIPVSCTNLSSNYPTTQNSNQTTGPWPTLVSKGITVNGEGVVSEMVLEATSDSYGNSLVFGLGTGSRLYFEVYGEECPEHSRNVTGGNLGSICLPYNVTVSECANVEKVFKVASITSTEVTLESVDAMEAGKPYIFRSEASATSVTFAFGGTTVAAPVADDYLVGNFAAMTGTDYVPVGAYVLQSNQFKLVNTENTIRSGINRCYLKAPANQGDAKAVLGISLDGGTTTSIEALNAAINNSADIYDINGRKLKTLQKGINIVNGKKIIVK